MQKSRMRKRGDSTWARTLRAAATAVALLALPSVVGAVCGDDVVDGEERCDGPDLGGRTCKDVTAGFAQGGTLVCAADCTLDTTDCRRAFLESLIPANRGPQQNRCHLEWGTVGTGGRPNRPTEQSCSDGDPTCDQDGEFNNSCSIRIQLCLNVPDQRIDGCAPGRITRVEVLRPGLRSTSGRLAASGVLAAAKGLAPEQSRLSGNAVSFGPPITDFQCGSNTVRIPLRGRPGRARPGKVAIRARTSDNSGRVRAVGNLTLVCTP
jgi:hypothetical protein